MHKLFRRRQNVLKGRTITQEVHWSELRRDTAILARMWIDVVYQHRGSKFRLVEWPRRDTKEAVILRVVSDFCRRKKLTTPPHDLVVFLDYDDGHAREKTQNQIREIGRVARCYHLDSAKNDCIQCCDLLLGVTRWMRSVGPARALPDNWPAGLGNSRIKSDLAAYLRSKVDAGPMSVYDGRPLDRTSG